MLALMQRVAAEVITPRFRSLAADEVIEKRPGDLVTVADREAEQLITDELRRAYPDALVVGEEATLHDHELLRRLPAAGHAFLVDPIDGTKNFVRHSPDHAVMVSELIDGEVTRGWIWQPEHERAYVAERGAGVRRNGAPVTRATPDLTRLGVAASRTSQLGPSGPVTVRKTAWCCAIDYPHVVEGGIDGLMYGRGKPWDHAAGKLMVEEAGGVVHLGDGETYRPDRVAPGNIVVAASAGAWDVMVSKLPRLAGRR